MKMNDLLKKAYIHEVVKHLPLNQREDIQKELSTIIDDLIENENMSLEEALISLGKPRDLANNYLDQKAYIIGPRYKTMYFQALKFLIPLIWTIIIIFNLLTLLFSGDFSFESMMSSAFNSTFVVFTYVTVGFMIAERVNVDKEDEEEWHPKELNVEKHQLKTWSKSSSYVGMISLIILMVLFNRFSHLIGINVIGSGDQVAFINQMDYDQFLPWINISLVILITRLFIRLFFPYYTKIACIISISLHALATVIFLFVILNPNFLNPNLTSELQAMNFPDFIDFDFIKNIFILTAIVVSMIFVIESFQEARYGIFKKI
jgi:hypothetical protein